MHSKRIQVTTSPIFESEKEYILRIYVEDYLESELDLVFSDEEKGYSISIEGRSVTLPDVFFGKCYYRKKTFNEIKEFEFSGELLPAWFHEDLDDFDCTADVFGMAFFLLSGYADLNFSEKDVFERNIGKTSFLTKHDLIDRPVIQEWFDALAKRLLSKSEYEHIEQRKFRKHISHDVDQPFEYLNYTLTRVLKRLLGDIFKRGSLPEAKKRIQNFLSVKNGDYDSDPYNNFEKLFRLLKLNNIRSTFFFVASDNRHPNDVNYSIEQGALKEILTKVNNNGHQIGVHPSFYTFRDENKLEEEVARLQSVLDDCQIEHVVQSSRKHYLRWDWESTLMELEAAGIKDDYTVGYADRSGFRVGVAFPYSAFNWKTKQKMHLKLHPLIVMECSLTSPGYMNVSYSEAQQYIDNYYKQLSKIGGEFVLLWHNHLLLKEEDINLFKHFLEL